MGWAGHVASKGDNFIRGLSGSDRMKHLGICRWVENTETNIREIIVG
jgi:hypothetical protein